MVNYTIKVGHSVDVGKLINFSLMNIIRHSTSVGLGHPSLVYSLCAAVVVLGNLGEEKLFYIFAVTR
ncbi:hypothetical protein MA16_Dca001606 [Dendrobium catenatum]|uniref:Uncharacterized protein n=1 Tax=Dendrobium catenatum TaxID=906689 RepID=A0A2I0WMW0_9ASPA|nr:hypothetical protein MA16_Dca001606 [Dendrobium catenatum]